ILRADFDPFVYFPWDQIYVSAMHPFSAIGYAALAMVVFDRRGALADRVSAVGRAAFTNYLGATIIGTLLFFDHGLGLYGELSRGQAWLFAPLVWTLMLLWSKPWLERYRYGPFEWAWRSLARWEWVPMRHAREASAATAWPSRVSCRSAHLPVALGYCQQLEDRRQVAAVDPAVGRRAGLRRGVVGDAVARRPDHRAGGGPVARREADRLRPGPGHLVRAHPRLPR